MAVKLHNNSDEIRLIEQVNHLLQENAVLKDQNTRTQTAYERADAERQAAEAQCQALQVQLQDKEVQLQNKKAQCQALHVQLQDKEVQIQNVQGQLDVQREENQEMEQENQRLTNRVVVLELTAAQLAENNAECAEKDARRDAQIAFLMANLNPPPPAPQQPVLLVPHNQPPPELLPEPLPLLVDQVLDLLAAPSPVIAEGPHQEPPIVEPKLRLAPAFDQLPPSPVVDATRVLPPLENSCTATKEKHLACLIEEKKRIESQISRMEGVTIGSGLSMMVGGALVAGPVGFLGGCVAAMVGTSKMDTSSCAKDLRRKKEEITDEIARLSANDLREQPRLNALEKNPTRKSSSLSFVLLRQLHPEERKERITYKSHSCSFDG